MSRPWARCAASTNAGGPWCSRAARASPWTTSPTSRCFRAGRKPGGPPKTGGAAREAAPLLPRTISCPARERAGAPMSRPWARCAASTNAGGPWCSRAARTSPWTTSPTSRCFKAGRRAECPPKTGGAAREAAPLLPRTISCPARERAGAPMSRPWARCAASTNAGGPWCSRAARASPWTTSPTSRCFRAGRKAGYPPKNRQRSPGGCAAFAANDFVPGVRNGALYCFRAGWRAGRAGCPGTGARPGRRPGTSSRPGRPRPRAPGTAGGSTGCCPAC